MSSNSFKMRGGTFHKENTNKITPDISKKIDYCGKSTLVSKTPSMIPMLTRHKRCLLPVESPRTPKKITLSSLKSKSLVQLTSSSSILAQNNMLTSKEQGDEPKTVFTLHRKCIISLINTKEEFKVARQVCTRFMLNAWRRRRIHVTALQNKNQKLKNEVQNLRLQTDVLHHLLQAEKARVVEAVKDSAQFKDRLEKELMATEILKKEVDSFKSEKSDWKNLQEAMNTEIETLKNKILVEQDRTHCSYLEMCTAVKMAKQRELEAHRKASEVEATLQVKINTLEEMMKLNINDLQAQLSQITSENKNLREEKEIRDNETNQFLNEKNEEITNLKRTCSVYQNNIKNLSKDLDFANEQIEGKEELVNHLKRVVETFEKEKEEVDNNLFNVRNKVLLNTFRTLASVLFPNPPNYLL